MKNAETPFLEFAGSGVFFALHFVCHKKKRSALNAWFWEDAETFLSTARTVKNALTSSIDNSAGSLSLEKFLSLRVHME